MTTFNCDIVICLGVSYDNTEIANNMNEQYLIFILLIWITTVYFCKSTCPRGVKFCWENKHSHKNLVFESDLLWVKKVKIFRLCAAACSQDVRCNSFTVTDPVQGKMRCRGHAFVDIPEEQGVTLNGTRYYWGK